MVNGRKLSMGRGQSRETKDEIGNISVSVNFMKKLQKTIVPYFDLTRRRWWA